MTLYEFLMKKRSTFYREIDVRPLKVDVEEKGAEFFDELDRLIAEWKRLNIEEELFGDEDGK